MNCKHCGRAVVQGQMDTANWYHVIGEGSVLRRCNPKESGGPYGLNAEPEDAS